MKNSDRMEWMVEKLTETGITSLTFLLTSNVERKTINLERLHKAAISAIKQSGRLWIPELHGPVKFSDLITKPFGGRHIASAGHKETPRLIDRISTPGDHLVLIGPEGDFSTAEFNLALVNGFHPVSLGGATLRTETAAFHACVAMNLAIGRS